MRRSIGLPLTLGIVLSLLALSLAVGWQILVVGDPRPMAGGQIDPAVPVEVAHRYA